MIKTHERNNPERPVAREAPPVSDKDKDGVDVLTVADLMDDPPDKPEFIWGGPALFKGSRVMIVGAPKTGKSRFLVSWLAELAMGRSFLSLKTHG